MIYNDEICKVLKKLRVAKQVKVSELVYNIMSKSYYYKIESGENRITAELLFQLLEKMNISVNEFLFLVNSDMAKKIDSFSYKKRISSIPEERNELNLYYFHLELLSMIEKDKSDTENNIYAKEIIKEYLFEKEDYFKYEIATFNNFLPILDLEIVLILYKSMLSSAETLLMSTYYRNEVIQFTQNLTYYFFLKNEIDLMIFCYEKMKQFIEINYDIVNTKNMAYFRFFKLVIECSISSFDDFYIKFKEFCTELDNNNLFDIKKILSNELNHVRKKIFKIKTT